MSGGSTLKGYCPMGCGSTLFVGTDGYVTCSYLGCPRPDAVADLLGDRETEHVVTLTRKDFTVRHPLRERLDGNLEACAVHQRIKALSGPPRVPGAYRVYDAAGTWVWDGPA